MLFAVLTASSYSFDILLSGSSQFALLRLLCGNASLPPVGFRLTKTLPPLARIFLLENTGELAFLNSGPIFAGR
jgi:hypothetical protein